MRKLFLSINYARVWIGTLATALAMNMQYVARGWFVYDINQLNSDLAWVLLAFTLPQIFFSLPGGVLADRFAKRTIIVVAHALNASATMVMGLLILGNRIEFSHFILFGILNGSILALSFPARQAIVPHVVKPDAVFSALALSATAVNISRVVGPALAGLLIYWIAAGDHSSELAVGIVFLVIASLYLLASLISLRITVPGKATEAANESSLKRDLYEVAEFLVHKRIVFSLVLLSIFAYMFGHTLNAFLPAFNESVLNGSAREYGFLLATLGIGSILGSLVVVWASDVRRQGLWLIGLQISWGALIFSFGFTSWMWLAFVLSGLIGWFAGAAMALNRSLLQSHVRTSLLGRVMSIDMMAHGMMPFAALPLGMLADTKGIDFALSVAGGLLVLTIALAVFGVGAHRSIAK
ncbi:MAG: MFS transporter [Gammaproteobacteria bacterium]|nr:MFS transporter [Gammaproteobacteria bacterium]